MYNTTASLDFIGKKQFHLTEMSQGENEEALQSLISTIETNISEGADKTDSLFSLACIYRVPKELRMLKENAYTPRLIAIGPLHQKDEHLKTPFQWVKKSYTKNLLLRLTAVKMEESETKYYEYPKVLQECVKKMKDCVRNARKCYAEELDVGNDQMLEMMLVDGCFILELLYRFDELKSKTKEAKNTPKEEGQEGKRNGASTSSDLWTPLLQASRGATRMQTPLVGESEIKTSSGTKTIDPILHCDLIASTVLHDLVLLENQIPFFVLEELFTVTVGRIQNNRSHKLDHYVFQYFDSMMSNPKKKEEGNSTSCCSMMSTLAALCRSVLWQHDESSSTSCVSPSDSTVVPISPNQMERYYYHILHKLHDYYVIYLPQPKPVQRKDQTKRKNGREEEAMPCASELEYAGVKFEPVQGKELLNVEFSDREWYQLAHFKIPLLEIYDNTEPFLRNFIAFEQCCPGVSISKHFSSYALLMDTLVNSEKDVEVLEKARVMRNHLGARADATNLFNNLCKEVAIGEFFFADTCSQATAYSKRRWPKFLARVQRTYFASPKTFIAFVVAFIAFAIQIVTFVQSVL